MIAPQACARSKTGMPRVDRAGDLGIIVVDGGGADDKVALAQGCPPQWPMATGMP